MDVVELLPMDFLEAEVRVEDLDEIVTSEVFKAESLEDFRVVDNVVGVMGVSFLTGPRSETGGEELDKRDRGEDERVDVVASVLLREKKSVSFLVCFRGTVAVALVVLFETIVVVVGDGERRWEYLNKVATRVT